MDPLAVHLAERYGVHVDRLVPLDQGVFRVDGPSWVARRFPPGTDEAVAATVQLLRGLEPTAFPAERLASAEPVSVCDGWPVLVTEFAAGRPAPATPRMFAALGGLLGALHARAGTVLRPGGGWHHLVAQGTPADEIAAARALLAGAAGDPAARRTLRDELGALDDCADLPHGVVHPDFVPVNVLRSAEHGLTVVDWAGAGRGPRLWSLGFLLWAAGGRSLDLVDAVASRYRDHVQLEAGELDRLPDAIRGRPLTIACWSVARGRMDPADAVRRLDRTEDSARRIAERARRAFGAGHSK